MIIYTSPLLNLMEVGDWAIVIISFQIWIMGLSLREIFRKARILELRISIGKRLKSNSEVEITRIETIV